MAALGRRLLQRGDNLGPILIAEDEAPLQQAMAAALGARGYQVLCARNGDDALQMAAISSPALVILDLQMPVLDGWGFVSALRRRGLSIPILVMTAGLEAARSADEMGAIGYLEKPFRLAQLLTAVAELIPVHERACRR